MGMCVAKSEREKDGGSTDYFSRGKATSEARKQAEMQKMSKCNMKQCN